MNFKVHFIDLFLRNYIIFKKYFTVINTKVILSFVALTFKCYFMLIFFDEFYG